MKNSWRLSSIKLSLCVCLVFSLYACNKQSEQNTTDGKASKKQSQPNVLVVFVDDLGWRDLGVNGSEYYETPNIDRLASQGALFNSAYASAPICSPSRAALLTGKHPARLGITHWIPGDHPQDRILKTPANVNNLALGETTIAEVFKTNGYNTFFAGKWHLGEEQYGPEFQGFDINKGGGEAGQPQSYYSPYKNSKLVDGPVGEHLTDRLTSETLQFIESSKNQPFFAMLSYYTVHTPIEAVHQFVDHYEKKRDSMQSSAVEARTEGEGVSKLRQDNAAYASMVASLDNNVGRLMQGLDALQLTDNTIVIFTSDNGGLSTLFPINGQFNRMTPTSNEPLRAGKGWLYEGGIRIPLIIRSPSGAAAGHKINTPVDLMDLFPTLIDLAHLSAPPAALKDGVSLEPLLSKSGAIVRENLYWHFPHYHGSASEPVSAIRSKDWKLLYFYETQHKELYNLAEDPSETHNLAGSNKEVSDQLFNELNDWMDKVGAKRPVIR